MTETMRSWLASKTAQRPRPLDVLFELTEVCNLRCRHCYLPAYDEVGLSTEEVKGILDQLAQAGTLFLTFTGGEPLTRPDFVELAAYARRKGLALRIFTNGTLLTSVLADQIRDLYPLGVEMSLYGATAQVHDATTRVAGSFERMVRGVRLLRERGVPVRLKVLLMSHNIHQAEDMRTLVEELDSVHSWDVYVTARRDGSQGPWAERATDEHLSTFFAKQAHELDEPMANEGLTQESLTKSLSEGDDRICTPGRMGCRIAADGRVYPCVEITECAGDLRCQSLDEIWQTSAVLQKFRQMREADLSGCISCAHSQRCVRRCPGLALLESGDLGTPLREACRLTELRYQTWKGSGEMASDINRFQEVRNHE